MSWWVGVPRGEWQAVLQQEWPQMQARTTDKMRWFLTSWEDENYRAAVMAGRRAVAYANPEAVALNHYRHMAGTS